MEWIIAEIAQAHDGSLGMAHAYIDAVAKAGAKAVKFQTHMAEHESMLDEPWRVKFSLQDETRYEYWKRMEFTDEQWHGLKRHADEKGLLFLSSPFSPAAVDLLSRIGVAAWKVASGEVNNLPMLDQMIATGLPILLSSGMSNWQELDQAVKRIQEANCPLTVFQCTTAYPCPPELVGLNLISVLRQRYKCAVGLSDHSGTIYAGLAATTIGIEALEVHVTFHREMFGPDVPASLTISEFQQLVEGIHFIEKMKNAPVDKEYVAQEMQPLHQLFTKSLVITQSLPAGTILSSEHLTGKKPGYGIAVSRLSEILGKRLKTAVQANHRLREEDID